MPSVIADNKSAAKTATIHHGGRYMQPNSNSRNTNGQDPFFRSKGEGYQQENGMRSDSRGDRSYVVNWGLETASEVGTQNCRTLGSKDLSILQDEMHSEALLCKKYSVYAGYFNDPKLRSLAQTAAEHHRRHFESLQSYLNASN